MTRATARWALLALALLGAASILMFTVGSQNDDGRLFFGLWRTRHLALAAIFATLGLAGFAAATSRRALFQTIFAFLMFAMLVVLLELPGLIGLVSYPSLLGNAVFIPTNDLGAGRTPLQDVEGETFFDTATIWGIEHEAIPFHYRTDRRGFRNPDDPDQADVYLIGDSIVVAGLVDWESTMTARLAERLERPVMNVALIGIGPEEEQALFRGAELPVDGRLVLQFLFEGNDLLDTARFHGPATPPTKEQPLRHRSFSYNAMLALQRWSQPVVGRASEQSCRIGSQRFLFHWTADSHLGLEREQTLVFDSLETFAAEIEANGGHFAVVFVPSKLRVLGPVCDWPAETVLTDPVHLGPLRGAVHAWSGRAGIPLIDLTAPLQAAAKTGAVPWFWGDTHWDDEGHAVAAETLTQAALVRSWLAATARKEAIGEARSN